MSKHLPNEAQPPITVDQITSIVLAIVESKLATLSNRLGQASSSTAEPAVRLTLVIRTPFTSYYQPNLLILVTLQHMWTKKVRKLL